MFGNHQQLTTTWSSEKTTVVYDRQIIKDVKMNPKRRVCKITNNFQKAGVVLWQSTVLGRLWHRITDATQQDTRCENVSWTCTLSAKKGQSSILKVLEGILILQYYNIVQYYTFAELNLGFTHFCNPLFKQNWLCILQKILAYIVLFLWVYV